MAKALHLEDHYVGGSLETISPSDSTAIQACFVYVGTGGDVAVLGVQEGLGGGDTSVTLKNVPSGSLLPVKVVKVYQTGTTASDLVAVR